MKKQQISISFLLVFVTWTLCVEQSAWADENPSTDWSMTFKVNEAEVGLLFPRAVNELNDKQEQRQKKVTTAKKLLPLPPANAAADGVGYHDFSTDAIYRINQWSLHLAGSQAHGTLPPAVFYNTEKVPPNTRTAVMNQHLVNEGKWLENVEDRFQTRESWRALTDELLRFEVARAQTFPYASFATVTSPDDRSENYLAGAILVRALSLSYLSGVNAHESTTAHSDLDAFYESSMGFPLNQDYMELMAVIRRVYMWGTVVTYKQLRECPSIQKLTGLASSIEDLPARLAFNLLGTEAKNQKDADSYFEQMYKAIDHLVPTQIFRRLGSVIRSQGTENPELASRLADLHIYLAITFSRQNLDLTLWPFLKDRTLDVAHPRYREAAYTNWLGFVFDHLVNLPDRKGDKDCVNVPAKPKTCFGASVSATFSHLNVLGCMVLDEDMRASTEVELPWFRKQQRVFSTPTYSRKEFAAYCDRIEEDISRLDKQQRQTGWHIAVNVKIYQLLADWLNNEPDHFGLTLSTLVSLLHAEYPTAPELGMSALERFASSNDCFVRPEHLAQLQKPISLPPETIKSSKKGFHIAEQYSADEKFFVDWLPTQTGNQFRQAALKRLSQIQDLPFRSQLTRPDLPKVTYGDSGQFDPTVWLSHLSRALSEAATVLSSKSVRNSEDVRMYLVKLAEEAAEHRWPITSSAMYQKPLALAVNAFLGKDSSALVHAWLFGFTQDSILSDHHHHPLIQVAITSDEPIQPLGTATAKDNMILFIADLIRTKCLQDLVFEDLPHYCIRIVLPTGGEYPLVYSANTSGTKGNFVISGPPRLVICKIRSGTMNCL